MKLKEITFIFENCEYITIDGKHVGGFLVEDICTSIQRIACNSIDKMDTAHTFAIEIHKDANKERCPFGCEGDKQLTFDRFISWDDITSIQFELFQDYVEEGQEPIIEHYDYYLHWTGESEYKNDSQKSYISETGNLYIVIADNKRIEDFFDKEAIDDTEHMNFVYSMYDKYSTRLEEREF